MPISLSRDKEIGIRARLVETGGQIVGLTLVPRRIGREGHQVGREFVPPADPVGACGVRGATAEELRTRRREIIPEGIGNLLVLDTSAARQDEVRHNLPVDLGEAGDLLRFRRGVPIGRREGRAAQEWPLELHVRVIGTQRIAERLGAGRQQADFLREQLRMELADLDVVAVRRRR